MRAITADSRQPFAEREVPTPQPGPRDVLVRVRAVALNPVDSKLRAAMAANAPPRILGFDAAGVVEVVGAEVSRFRVGDAVYYAGDMTRPGCLAQWQCVDERLAGRKPASLGFEEAAALPLASLTAWESLFERLGAPLPDAAPGPARRLLIIGAAGGVGSIAIQLAKLAGLTVIATASRPESQAWCRQLGADLCVSHAGDLTANLRAAGVAEVDYLFNCNSTDAYWPAMAELIKPQGAVCCLVSAEQPVDLNRFKNKSATIAWEFMFTRALFQTENMAEQGAILDRVAAWADQGRIRSTLAECLGPLTPANLEEGYARLAAGRSLGKWVLQGMPF